MGEVRSLYEVFDRNMPHASDEMEDGDNIESEVNYESVAVENSENAIDDSTQPIKSQQSFVPSDYHTENFPKVCVNLRKLVDSNICLFSTIFSNLLHSVEDYVNFKNLVDHDVQQEDNDVHQKDNDVHQEDNDVYQEDNNVHDLLLDDYVDQCTYDDEDQMMGGLSSATTILFDGYVSQIPIETSTTNVNLLPEECGNCSNIASSVINDYSGNLTPPKATSKRKRGGRKRKSDKVNSKKRSLNQKQPGRPRKQNKPVKARGRLIIWEFWRDILLKSIHTDVICWTDRELGIFKFKDPIEAAKLWGDFTGRKNMDYEKMTRAIRYHYKFERMCPGEGHLRYQFGKNAVGWREKI